MVRFQILGSWRLQCSICTLIQLSNLTSPRRSSFTKIVCFPRLPVLNFTLRGWKSYFTQCWKPFPLDFKEVTMRQFPTKCAEYPIPLLVRKLQQDQRE